MSRTITNSYSVTLVPSGYNGATNGSLTNPSNAYREPATSGNYATFAINQSSTGYVYFTFDTSEIPANATITSITGRFAARVSNTTRVTNTTAQLYSGTTAKGSSVAFGSTTVSIRTLTPGTGWTKADLNDLRLRLGGTGSSSSSSRQIRLYGADVTINYTVQETEYEIIASVNQDATLSSTDEFVASGESFTLSIIPTDGSSAPTSVTDNNVDVTNSLQILSGGTKVVNLSDYTGNTNFTLTDISNAYNSSSNTSDYARLDIAGGSITGSIYFTFSDLNIPSGATILSYSASAAIQFSRNGSSSGVTASCQMYSGTTAKGSSQTITTSATDVARTVYNFTMETWTASELNNARLYITCTNNASSTHRYIYVYGADLSVTYEIDGYIYTYTISNVQTDHTIVVTYVSGPSYNIYVKQNGSWVKGTLYVKDGNTWKEASSILVKDNGTWK